MVEYRETIEIAAPPTDVWAVLYDVERWPTWSSTMTSVAKEADAPLAPGSRARVRQPRLRPAVWVVDEVEPGRSFQWTTRNGGVHITADHRIAPADGGSSVELSLVMTGPMAWLGSAMYGRLSRRYLHTEAESLKRTVEAGT